MTTPNPSTKPAPFARELIEKEIEHLKKGKSVRQARDSRRSRLGAFICGAAFILVGLWGLDPVLYSYNRGEAIHAYLYLHNYGDDHKAAALAACGLLTPDEVHKLNVREGKFQDYFNGTAPAEEKAVALIRYMDGVHALHENRYDALTPLNKLRYILFIKTGLTPPIQWDCLDSSIDK